MFIDMHVHTRLYPGPERTYGGTYATPEELMAMLKPHGVRKAVILPGANPECAFVAQGMGEALAIVEKYPDFFISFMNIDPRQMSNSPEADLSYLMRYYKEHGCKGIGEVCANLPFDDPLMENLFRHAEAEQLPLTFHIAPEQGGYYGIDRHRECGQYAQMDALRRIQDRVGNSRLQIAGTGFECRALWRGAIPPSAVFDC